MPTTSPLDDPEFISAVTSPEFLALPWETRRAKISKFVPEFAASTPADQNNILGMIQKKGNMRSTPTPPALQPDPTPQQPTAPDTYTAHFKRFISGDKNTSEMFPDRFPGNVLNYPLQGVNQMANGVVEVGAARPMAGVNDVLGGGIKAASVMAPEALPALLTPAGVAAGAAGIAGGYAGGNVARAGVQAMGGSSDAQGVAEKLGGLAGGVGLSGLLSKASPAIGTALRDSAKTQYSRVLNATTQANKATSARIVPQLLDRGVSAGSAKGLLSHFEGQRDAAGQALNDAWFNIPAGATVPLNPVLDAMDKHASDSFLSPSGKPLSAEAAKGISIVQDLGQRLADESTADPQSGDRVVAADALRRYRQEWDRITNKANGFTSTLDDTTSGGAHNIGGDAARASINGQFPAVDAANQEYGLWKDASRVMGDTMQRRQGQAVPLGQKIAKAAGAAAGYGVGGVHGGLLGGAAMDGLETAGASVPWNTNMARLKYGVGGLLQQAPTAPPVPYWVPGLLSATVRQ